MFSRGRNYVQVHFREKLKPLRIGPNEILDLTIELLPRDGFTFHTHRTNLIPFIPKEPLLYRHLRMMQFMQFSDLINFDISKSNNHASCDSYTFNSDESLSDDETFSQPQENFPLYQKL